MMNTGESNCTRKRILYFAWVRERMGRAQEELALPTDVRTVADLLAWLRGLDETHAEALQEGALLRVAVDRQHAEPDTPVTQAREIAIFPPVTGG